MRERRAGGKREREGRKGRESTEGRRRKPDLVSTSWMVRGGRPTGRGERRRREGCGWLGFAEGGRTRPVPSPPRQTMSDERRQTDLHCSNRPPLFDANRVRERGTGKRRRREQATAEGGRTRRTEDGGGREEERGMVPGLGRGRKKRERERGEEEEREKIEKIKKKLKFI